MRIEIRGFSTFLSSDDLFPDVEQRPGRVLCIGSALSSVRLDGYIMGFRLGCRHISFFFFFDGFPFEHEIIIDL
jgi:hypothetical protein